MALSNMKDYSTEIQGNAIEILGQQVEKFNAASGGAIVLTSAGFSGSYEKEAFWASLSGAQRRVERNEANSSQSTTTMTQSEIVAVKIAGGFGPILLEESQLTWLKMSPGEAITAIATSLANAVMADQLNTGLVAADAAIGNIAGLVNDVSATLTQSYTAINGAHAKFGDSSSMIVADVMSGRVYHQLVAQNIANSNELFVAGNVRVVDILGKTVVITDAPALSPSASIDHVVSLVAGGIVISDGGDMITNIETTNGMKRIETTFQADYTFGTKLKGYAWDVTNGGSSPTDAELGTGSNWDIAVTDNKHTAGVLTIGDNTK